MKFKIVTLFLFASLLTFGQEKIVFIKDSITQEVVPFAAIQFMDKQSGIYADENGKAVIPDSVHHILISQIAYHAKDAKLQAIENNSTILLAPSPYILPEVIVSNISAKRKEIGFLQKKGSNGVIATPNTNFALFIPYDSSWNSQPYVTAIISYLDDIKGSKDTPVTKCNICFDLRLSNENGTPSNVSLLEKRIINNSTKTYNGKETVKLTEPILFPKEGLFIVIDFITPNNPNPRLLINPTLDVTGAGSINQTWSRSIEKDFKWEKLDRENKEWGSLIPFYYGEKATIMNLRAGLQIAY